MYDHLSKLPTTVKICRTTQGVGEGAQLWLEPCRLALCVFFTPVLEFNGTFCPRYPTSIHLTLMLSFIFSVSNFPWGNLLRKKLIFSNWGMWFEILILGASFISSVAWRHLMVMSRISVGSLVGKIQLQEARLCTSKSRHSSRTSVCNSQYCRELGNKTCKWSHERVHQLGADSGVQAWDSYSESLLHFTSVLNVAAFFFLDAIIPQVLFPSGVQL